MATETELKYAIRSEDESRLILESERIGSFEFGDRVSKRVRDEYLDTQTNDIRSFGYAFRLRTSNGRRTACLKGLGLAESALHTREEIEAELSVEGTPETWPESEVRDRLIRMIGKKKLKERAVIEQTRHKREVLTSGRVFAELTVDEVEMIAGDRSHRCTELEVELTDPSQSQQLEEFDRTIAKTLGLEAVRESKFERAMKLFDDI